MCVGKVEYEFGFVWVFKSVFQFGLLVLMNYSAKMLFVKRGLQKNKASAFKIVLFFFAFTI